jgi:hypothetical protein
LTALISWISSKITLLSQAGKEKDEKRKTATRKK